MSDATNQVNVEKKSSHRVLKIVGVIALLYIAAMVAMTVTSDPNCVKNAESTGSSGQGAVAVCSTFKTISDVTK